MARPLRIDYPGGHYHITSRGVGKQDVFFNDEDRLDFLDRLKQVRQRMGIVIHAYCLMQSHIHLELETPEGYLSRSMQWLIETYASSVNRRHKRVGHLFQGRFKSTVIEAETHLAALTRYIHLNPVRAGLVDHPSEYQWSSYGAYVGLVKQPEWLTTSATLERFGVIVEGRRHAYRKFVEGEEAENPLREMVYGAIVGSEKFVSRMRELLQRRRVDSEASRTEEVVRAVSPAKVSRVVAAAYGYDEVCLRVRDRKKFQARDIAIHLSRELTKETHAETGSHFGGIRPSAVSLACKRVTDRMRKDAAFRYHVDELMANLTGRKE